MEFSGEVRSLDTDVAATWGDVYDVECEATRAVRPGWVPLGRAARVAAWRSRGGWTRRLVGAVEGDALIGYALTSTAHDTADTSWVDVSVLPGHQCRGVGTALVRAAEASAPGSAARYVASAVRPTAADITRLDERFALPLGYVRATTETVVELDLAAAALPAPRPPAGFEVTTYLDGVPAALRAQVGVLKGLVDAEAPHGELGWQPAPVSVQAYEDEIFLWRQQGRTAIESIALEGGDVAAWTCLLVAADSERPAQVEGTLVTAERRGRGLGRAVKVASLAAARDHGAARVRTSSDDRNVGMRALNDALGFVPVAAEVLWHKERR